MVKIERKYKFVDEIKKESKTIPKKETCAKSKGQIKMKSVPRDIDTEGVICRV